MKVTVLGAGAAYPGPGETCSGFLIQQQNTNLLVDCGNGVLSNLQKFLSLPEITDIYISHMHADHFFDLVLFRYGLYYGFEKNSLSKPHLHLPPGGAKVLEQVVNSFAETDAFFQDVFEIDEYEAGKKIKLADLEMIPVKVKHYVPSYGVSIIGDLKMAYSSDTGECDGLYEIANKADLFVCNIGNSLESGRGNSWGHLNPEQAGTLAEKAGVKRMLVSHIRQGNEKEQYIKRAAVQYKGALELARDCTSYEVI